MSWPFETSPPHVTPESWLDYYCRREGLTTEQLALPPTLVATFQGASHARMVEQTGATPPVEVAPRPGSAVAATSILVGKTPRREVPVAVTRISVGAPAAALALEMAIVRGVRNILVCGSAGSLQSGLPLGSTVVVTGAEREDGTSYHYLPSEELTLADPSVVVALEGAARELGVETVRGRAWTIDAPYRETVGAIRRHQAAGIAVVEMEAAAIFAVAKVRGARAGLIVAVSDELFDSWNPGFHLTVYVDALTRAADATLLAAEVLGEEGG